jgi:hypothetical protein
MDGLGKTAQERLLLSLLSFRVIGNVDFGFGRGEGMRRDWIATAVILGN